MKNITLGKRLCAAASFVRDGAVVADIGTDHAYLPIYLVSSGIASRAVASDIKEGPAACARENVRKFMLDNKIDVRVADGLCGIEKYKPTDIVICGMGGELIADIIDASEYVKDENVRLILQPMTSIKELRSYLSDGFLTIDENIAEEDGKLYQIICAQYDGKKRSFTEAELELGKENIRKRGELFEKLLNLAIAKKQKAIDGQRLGGRNVEELEMELKELEGLR